MIGLVWILMTWRDQGQVYMPDAAYRSRAACERVAARYEPRRTAIGNSAPAMCMAVKERR